jgi:predicted dehydrogenase
MLMSKMAVGLIGCGRVATTGHLPAYRKYDVPVAAVCDTHLERANAAALEFGVPRVFTNPVDLARCNDVAIIDVATRPSGRAELLRDLLTVRKPLLVQKPITYSTTDAEALLREVEGTGVPVAVNHNARWSPVHVTLHEWIRGGELGQIYAIHHVNRFNEDLRRWYTDHPDYLFIDHGIHYFDLIRWHTGLEPTAISALSSRAPGQIARCPLLYAVQMRFDVPVAPLVSLVFNNAVPTPGGFSCDWYIDAIRCTVHLTLDSIQRVDASGTLGPAERLPGGWVPDGFHGAYSAFVDAVMARRAPPHSLADHVRSLRVAAAAARSAERRGDWVDVSGD